MGKANETKWQVEDKKGYSFLIIISKG